MPLLTFCLLFADFYHYFRRVNILYELQWSLYLTRCIDISIAKGPMMLLKLHPGLVKSSLNVFLDHVFKLASCKSALNTAVVYFTDRSKAVVPVLVLPFVALWFILWGNLFYVLPCVILFSCFFSPFSIAIISLGEERVNLSAFRTFVSICGCFVLSVSPSS